MWSVGFFLGGGLPCSKKETSAEVMSSFTSSTNAGAEIVVGTGVYSCLLAR